ncbi:MAG: hypothetical protein JO200_08430 [Comamonas sp.]|nr:hypothetical protein [Comamonas sp.]
MNMSPNLKAELERLLQRALRKDRTIDQLHDLMRKDFQELCGAPIDTDHQMEEDWHEEIRLTALRSRDRLRLFDCMEMRDQIMESVEGDVDAAIFGSVFADDPDMVERCLVHFVRCSSE